MLIKFLPIILKIQSYDENLKEKDELTTKKKILHYFILGALYLINSGIAAGADLFAY